MDITYYLAVAIVGLLIVAVLALAADRKTLRAERNHLRQRSVRAEADRDHFLKRANHHAKRESSLDAALSRINQREKDKLDGLPKGSFMGIDRFGVTGMERHTALTHSAFKHTPTGLTIDENSAGTLLIKRPDGSIIYTNSPRTIARS